jgi:hypothetical protein
LFCASCVAPSENGPPCGEPGYGSPNERPPLFVRDRGGLVNMRPLRDPLENTVRVFSNVLGLNLVNINTPCRQTRFLRLDRGDGASRPGSMPGSGEFFVSRQGLGIDGTKQSGGRSMPKRSGSAKIVPRAKPTRSRSARSARRRSGEFALESSARGWWPCWLTAPVARAQHLIRHLPTCVTGYGAPFFSPEPWVSAFNTVVNSTHADRNSSDTITFRLRRT